MKNTKNKRKELGLLNFEGPVIKLYKENDDEFVLYDQWDVIMDVLTFNDLCKFLDGHLLLTDSQGKTWNWAKEHSEAKPKFMELFNYIKGK